MLCVITGGGGSGKSEYAENIAVRLFKEKIADGLIYIAAMQPYGIEAEKRIARHQKLRAGKGFETLECYYNLKDIEIKPNCVVLIECMSNLAANEIFDQKNKNATADIINGIKRLCGICAGVVVVTNDIFADGVKYDKPTTDYIKCLAEINISLSAMAESVTEVVCGIPVSIKG